MSDPIQTHIETLGQHARAASRALASASTQDKNAALAAAATALRAATPDILEANADDMKRARDMGVSDAFLDRLFLDQARVEAMAAAMEAIIDLPDPVGRQLAHFDRPNGLKIDRVSVPLGVIGMIYESRPNVGADAGALCIKSGNAVILRGGSDSARSSAVIVSALQDGLKQAGLPAHAIQRVEMTDREAVRQLLRCTEYVDLVIPRGGKGLVSLVRDQALVPTLLHLDGNCHTYIHAAARPEMAVEVVRNAKLRRTGICGATESLVIDAPLATELLPHLVNALEDCEIVGDELACAADARIRPATPQDWSTEYLDRKLSVKVVEDLDDALDFINRHSSGHTDAILTEDDAAAARFLTGIDSAVVMHNTSTQFSDGGEFGMGAEIGIATGKMHARGPVGLEQLNTFKYVVRGQGQVRP
ncbi:glutamate-5-semialdehyde dehydrogenase [Maricaulis sp. D1M11]|uniref:glutamate-5-semialdehyde dehydrogenase n=1 Tax=Maricaulis sp. D1M11 TaxID=3076117 RepID=UPI0039B4E408